MADGVEIEFGDSRRDFEKVIAALGITGLLASRPQRLHIHNAVVSTGSRTSFNGYAIPDLANLPIIDSLAAIQADFWSMYKQHGMYPKIRAEGSTIVSKLVLATPLIHEGALCSDPSLPGIVLQSSTRYTPSFNSDRPNDSLEYFFMGVVERAEFPRNYIGPLAGEMAVKGLQLAMPGTNYSIKIGQLRGAGYHPAINPIEGVCADRKIKVQAGRARLA